MTDQIPPMPEPSQFFYPLSADHAAAFDHASYAQSLEAWGRDLARRLRAILNSHAIVSDALAQAVKREDEALTALDALTRELDDQERSHLKTIDQRDAAEDALGDAYALVTGNQPEWSNHFGYADAMEEITEMLDHDRSQRDALQARVGKLEEAVEKGLEWFHDPDENALAQFERIGDWFYREAGHLRPGKDDRMEDTSSPENRDRFLKWCHGKSRERLALFRAALASREGGEG